MEKTAKVLNYILTTVVEIFCLISLTILGFLFYDSYLVNQQASSTAAVAGYRPQADPETGKMSLSELQAINPDIVGWVTLYDTGLDYPVLQGDPEFTYLNHDFEGKSSLTGSLYIGINADRMFHDDYTIIYGHHMAGGLMLGCLDYYADADFFESHKTGELITEDGVYKVEVLGFASTDAYADFYVHTSKEDLMKALDAEDGNKIDLLVGTRRDIDMSDHILIFSTCSSVGTTARTILITRLTLEE